MLVSRTPMLYVKAMSVANMSKGLRQAIDAVGSVHKLARALGIRQQSLWKWREVPTERILDVERATGIPREELRPDLAEIFRPRITRPRQ
jgi:DNA-binding transcriptional regulator YdaS (Cro superfamily)